MLTETVTLLVLKGLPFSGEVIITTDELVGYCDRFQYQGVMTTVLSGVEYDLSVGDGVGTGEAVGIGEVVGS